MSTCPCQYSQNPCEFTEPTVPDLGCCHQAKVSISGEAPTIPTLATVTYNPDATPPFEVV